MELFLSFFLKPEFIHFVDGLHALQSQMGPFKGQQEPHSSKYCVLSIKVHDWR